MVGVNAPRLSALLATIAVTGCDVAGDTRYLQFDWSAKVDGQPASVSHVV